MESSYLLLLQAFVSLFAFLLVYIVWTSRTNKIIRGKKLPQPPGAWPLIGHLHLLASRKTPAYRIIGALADKNGPIFQMKLGRDRAMVVSSWEAVKECFSTNDQVLLSRPTKGASRYLAYGEAMFGFSPDGPYWRHVRKIATLEVLSNRRLELLKHVRVSEVDTCIKDLYKLWSSGCTTTVDMSRWFSTVSFNVMVRMIAGKPRYSCFGDKEDEESHKFLKTIHEFLILAAMIIPSDLIPGIEWLDLQGHIKSMKRNAEELDYFLSSWLEEHLQDQKVVVKEERDFIHTMISLMADDHDASFHGFDTKLIIKATALSLIIGGTDTSSVTMVWAISLLLNHGQVLKNVQQELDIQVGRERWVEEEDMKKLIHLQTVIKETLRLYPAAPLAVPREATEDCNVAGYFVPKGTQVFVNIWKLHHDSRVWTDPKDFKPERFLTSHAHFDVRGHNFEYIPFSSGRRSCPGTSSAMQVMSLTLGRLLQGFHIATPMNESVDMTEGSGINMPKATPLRVILSPRLPDAMYV